MKNFKNPRLYDNEIGLFKEVIKNRVETLDEYNQTGRFRISNAEDEDDDIKTLGATTDWADFDASMSDWGASDSFGSGFDAFDVNTHGDANAKSLPQNEWINLPTTGSRILHSLRWSMQYTYNGLFYDNPWAPPGEGDEDKHKDTLIAFSYALIAIGVLSLIAMTGLITIMVHPVVGLLCIAGGIATDYINLKRYNMGMIKHIMDAVNDDEEEELDGSVEEEPEESEDEGFGDDLFGDSSFGGDMFGDTFDTFGGFDDTSSTQSISDMYDDYVDNDEEGMDDFDPEEQNQMIQTLFPNSPVNTRGSEEEFNQGMLDVFYDANKYKGVMYRSRKELAKSFAKYMPSNDSSFASWYDIKPHSPEYDNIAFTVYKALAQIESRFDEANNSKDKLVVFSIKRTPLIYKIEMKLPTYFKENRVLTAAKIFESYLKASDQDKQVGCIISTFGGNYVFKFLRLDYKGLISYGDILRYQDPDSGNAPIESLTEDKGVPILVGMENNEYPYIFDLESNTSGSVVGGSGSGKSWLTFQLMINMLMLNTPEEVNFLILDAKDAPIWKQFAKAPHVLGYHSNIDQYIEILQEVQQEHNRRQAELSRLQVEDYKDLRARYKSTGDWEGLARAPFLVVVIDEVTFTMKYLREQDKELYDTFRNIVSALSAVVRSSGIRLIMIGQRAIDQSIPKDYMANASMRFAMKMDEESDFGRMLGDDYKKIPRLPSIAGEGLIRTASSPNPYYIKTLVPGGTSTSEIMTLIRMVSLDWVRRTIGTDIDYYQAPVDMRKTIVKGFNRPDFFSESMQLLREGKIINDMRVEEGYQVNITPGQSGQTSYAKPPAEFNQIEAPAQPKKKVKQPPIVEYEEESESEEVAIDFSAFNDAFDEPVEENTWDDNIEESGSDLSWDFEDMGFDSMDFTEPKIDSANKEEDDSDFDSDDWGSAWDEEEFGSNESDEVEVFDTGAWSESDDEDTDYEEEQSEEQELESEKESEFSRTFEELKAVATPPVMPEIDFSHNFRKQEQQAERQRNEVYYDESEASLDISLDDLTENEELFDEFGFEFVENDRQPVSKEEEQAIINQFGFEFTEDEPNTKKPADNKQSPPLAKLDIDDFGFEFTEDDANTEESDEQVSSEIESEAERMKRELEEQQAEIERQRQALKEQQAAFEKEQERLRQAAKKEEVKEPEPIKAPSAPRRQRKRRSVGPVKPQIQPEVSKEERRGAGLSIKQYIIEYGLEVDKLSRSLDKRTLAEIYPQREIKTALRMGDIYSQGQNYVAQIL